MPTSVLAQETIRVFQLCVYVRPDFLHTIQPDNISKQTASRSENPPVFY